MKWSPPRATTLNPAVESPKAKCSSSKGRHHHSSGHSSNTSTPKCPDSTSAKKPSSSKEPTSNDQEKSPWSHSSCKCSHSPSLSTESVGHKWKGVCTEDTCALNSTLTISSSAFDSFHSPTGSHSDVTELQPPSITLTPLGLGTDRQWQTASNKSRHSLALIYTSPGFNPPGYPATGPGNLTPSIPSLTGSHHMSSTWSASAFTSGPSSPHLTIDQANSLFKLATECQALDIKLAKQFQVLSGLEAMHNNSISGMVHETLMLKHSAQEATYSAILWDRVSEDEHETTTHCLHSEADAAWKEMHEVMYNHQFQYDHHSSGRSSNTSTPKCPDSTSAKKPSSSKEPTSNDQEKSPWSHSSCKCGHSPSLSTKSVGHKWKGFHTEDTRALNSTLPISSSVFYSFHSPTGSHSDVTELQPPSITSTPLGLGTPRQWRTM